MQKQRTSIKNRKSKAELICKELERLYPNAVCSLEYSQPHELMIAGRLSAQCKDERVNVVTRVLFEKYKSIDDFADADVADIEEIIKELGLFRQKAKSIVAMCRKIRDDFGGQIPSTVEELTTLSGIGRKTANLVMGDVFHKPAVVTDTHCIRICKRLGLTTTDDPYTTEMELWELLEPAKASDFCHRIVHFGRDICDAKKPRCEVCTMGKNKLCTYVSGKNKREENDC